MVFTILKVVLGLIVVLVAVYVVLTKDIPRIHDITTDTVNPPQFVSLLEVRKNSRNGFEYKADKIAKLQKAAYPDIQSLILPKAKSEAFNSALQAAKNMDWQIVDSNETDGRIEATATTKLMKFKDDVVIRILEVSANQSKIDIRSMSRLGKSDLGANAKRIREYFKKF